MECDKGYTSLYAMLKISALSEMRASWRLHGGVRQISTTTFSAYLCSAEVAKSVDAVDSKSTVEIRAGSSPAFGTTSYANRVAQGRLFLCLKSSIRKAFLAFSLNLSQPDSIYINLLMRVQLRVFPGSIMFVPTQGP